MHCARLAVGFLLLVGSMSSMATVLDTCEPASLGSCLRNDQGSIVAKLDVQDFINISHQTISTVVKMPRNATRIDLSYNQIKSLPANSTDNSSLQFLNISHNDLDQSVVAVLPSTLTDLDLSFNRGIAQNNSLLFQMSWSFFTPQLTRLSCRGNNLTSVTISAETFPDSLASLDLSDNPNMALTLDQTTFERFSKANFSLGISRQFLRPTCGKDSTPNALPTGIAVCVQRVATTNSSTGSSTLVSTIPIVVSITIVVAILLRSYLIQCLCPPPPDLDDMETVCSSVCHADSYLDTRSPTIAIP
ncbi:hypothetical protein LEN26_011540 [Aphanomyces euteiches]|nr:hypothetical protein LEN26_011540 [Aphanomyces euteiches]